MDNIQPGQTIGPYRILNQVGQGGMATVYRAYHPAMDRYVAIKLLPRKLAETPEFIGRFRQEARTIAKLEHSHILPVHDYGEAEGFTYLVMRYLEAGTLKERLQGQALSLREVDRIFTQLADALDYAHAQGIVHRDLKPSNVLLDARGNVFLTDFGIAKLLQSDVNFTSTGAMIGTPAYMSPEQAQGLPVDQRSDIYSLGIILYEMVTGRVPYEADTPLAIILKHVNAPLPLPSSVRPGLHPALEKVLLRALAKEPAERFANIDDLVAAWRAALQEANAGTPTVAVQAPPLAAGTPPTVAPTAGWGGTISTGSGVGGTISAGSGVATPAARARPRWLAPAGVAAALAVLLCAGGLCAYLVYDRLFPLGGTPVAGNGGEATEAATAQGEAASPEPTLFLTAFAPGDTTSVPVIESTPEGSIFTGSAQSWTAANTVEQTVFYNDQLVTGGPGGLVVWDPNTGEVVDHVHTGNGLPGVYVNALLTNPDGDTLYIGTDNGLLIYTGDQVTTYNSETGLDSSFISAVAPSDEGLLVGTFYSDRDGGGLQRQVGEAEWESLDFPSVNTEDDPTQLSNRVTTLLVDPDSGDIWAGTTTGLGRYDGSEWTRYGVDEGLPNAVITGLKLVEGTLLVGTQGGLAAFSGEGFEAVSEVTLQPVVGIVPASDGSLWLSGGGGIWRRNPDGEWVSWDYTNLPSYGLYGGVEGPNGTLYFGSEDGLVTFQGDDYNFWRAPAVPVHEAFDRILPRPDAGELWFSDEYSAAPDILNTSDLAWQPPPDGSVCDGCDPLVFDETGRAWAGGDSGLWVFETSGEISHYATGDGLPSDLVRSVAVGPEGTAWIGTDAGLVYFDNGEFPTAYDTSNSELKDNYVLALLLASDGSLWVGTNSGLNRVLDDGTLLTYGQDNPFAYDVAIYDLAEAPNGDIWVATKGNGLFRYRPADDGWDHYGPEVQGVALDSNDYNCVAVAADGSVWVGGSFDYAHYFDGETWYAFGIEQGLIHSNVNDIYVDADGVVWFATSGGVTRYEP